MLCIGHRGAMGYEPENTLLSIEKALELGVDGIEIDVYNVEDNLVAIHDRDLSRTTNGKGNLNNCSFAYLRSLDAGKGQQVPTLEEIFTAIDRQVFVNIELKGDNTASLVVDSIHSAIVRGWKYADFVVSSFNHYQLKVVKEIEPRIKIGMLIYGLPWQYIQTARKLAAEIVISNLDYVDAEMVDAVRQENLAIWVYTVNRERDLNRMRELKVDGIFTNYPDLVNKSITF